MTEGTRARIIVIDDPYSVAATLMTAGTGITPTLFADNLGLDRFRLGDELYIIRNHPEAVVLPTHMQDLPDLIARASFRKNWPIPPRPAFIVQQPPSKRARRRARGRGRA